MKKILYIDDELWLMEGVIVSLREEYNVTAVRTVDQALDLLESPDSNFNLVVLDIRMPQGDRIHDPNRGRTMGLSLAQKLKEKGNKIPIVVYTVVQDEEIHQSLRELGVKSILMKTEPPSKLKREIKRWLE